MAACTPVLSARCRPLELKLRCWAERRRSMLLPRAASFALAAVLLLLLQAVQEENKENPSQKAQLETLLSTEQCWPVLDRL